MTKNAIETNKYWYTGNYGVNIELTVEQAFMGNHMGQCDSDITRLRTIPEIKKQLDAIPVDALRKELIEYGAWDKCELDSHDDNLSRILWIACGDISENNNGD